MEKRIITVRDLIDELEKVKDKNVTFCVSVNEVEHTPDLFYFTLLDFSDNYDNDRVILDLYR
jgi:ribosome-binding factor A